MKKKPFRDYHILEFFKSYNPKEMPLDRALRHYFKHNRALGAKDRAEIAETVYGIIRWLGLVDFFCKKPITYEKRLQIFRDLSSLKKELPENMPEHIAVSFPKVLFNKVKESHGQKAKEICLALNKRAPLTIRVNSLKISRDKLFNGWKEKYRISLCRLAKDGIIFHEKINLFSLPEFKEGFFEIQDEASQLAAEMVDVKRGDSVLDFCAGAGGKALAIAARLGNSGQIYLHDIRKKILQDAKKRFKRAGAQNFQIFSPDDPKLKKLKKKMDWVIADVPCTGSGTYRRNPDMKWRFSGTMLKELVGKQRHIFEKALSFLKPDGKIAYFTCSILQEENQLQVAHFLKTYNLSLVGTPLQTIPKPNGMDGFFAAIFSRS